MNDVERNKLWEDRAEWLTRNHKIGSFTVTFDADQLAVVLSTGYALVSIPVKQISELSGFLMMMSNQLSVCGVI